MCCESANFVFISVFMCALEHCVDWACYKINYIITSKISSQRLSPTCLPTIDNSLIYTVESLKHFIQPAIQISSTPIQGLEDTEAAHKCV